MVTLRHSLPREIVFFYLISNIFQFSIVSTRTSLKMAEKFIVKGYEEFVEMMKDLKTEGKIVNVLFTGEKNENVSSIV